MVTLGQSVFALGGQRQPSDDSTLDVIEVFDPNSESWSLHTSSLLSKQTKNLAVSELPLSAVSCNQGCQCGVRSGSRIIGGVEAEVISSQSRIFHLSIFCQAMDHPWMGLLLTEGETQAKYSRCAATLVDKDINYFSDFLSFPRLEATSS